MLAQFIKDQEDAEASKTLMDIWSKSGSTEWKGTIQSYMLTFIIQAWS